MPKLNTETRERAPPENMFSTAKAGMPIIWPIAVYWLWSSLKGMPGTGT